MINYTENCNLQNLTCGTGMGPPAPQDQLRDPRDFRDTRDLVKGSKKKKFNKKEGDKKSKDFTNDKGPEIYHKYINKGLVYEYGEDEDHHSQRYDYKHDEYLEKPDSDRYIISSNQHIYLYVWAGYFIILIIFSIIINF